MASRLRLFRVIVPVTNLDAAVRFYRALFDQPGERVSDGRLPMGRIAERPWGERSFHLQDPSGNPLCIVDEATVCRGGAVQ
jgi:hypothetical protein